MDTKPCPFCASNMAEFTSWFTAGADRHREFAIMCTNCGTIGPSDLGKSGAVEMWNMRRTEFPNTTEHETNPQA